MSIASAAVKHGLFYGLGAALNVALGFIPRRVDIFNVTDGTVAAIGYLDKMLPFTTGTVAPAPGAKVVGATSGAKAQVKDVILASGTFAAGNAAGFIIIDADTVVGTFQGENLTFSNDASGATDAVATGAAVEHTLYQSAALGFVSGSGNTGITSYVGAPGTAAKGFSVGSSLAANGKLYRYTAYRSN